MKTKTLFVLFSNTNSLRGMELTYLNSMKLGYPTLLSFDCRARALKLCKHLKKEQNYPSQLGQKGH